MRRPKERALPRCSPEKGHKTKGLSNLRSRRLEKTGGESSASVKRRLAGYLRSACRRWQGREIQVKAASIADTFGVSVRSVRRAIEELREGGDWVFRRVRSGRSFSLFVRVKQLSVQGDIATIREVSPTGEINSNPSRWQSLSEKLDPTRWHLFRRGSRGVRRLAWAMARRDLANLHWDNCKVDHWPAMAYRFALDCLNLGILQEDIVRAYDRAVHKFHQVATDRGEVFAPSGTVALARRLVTDRERRGKIGRSQKPAYVPGHETGNASSL